MSEPSFYIQAKSYLMGTHVPADMSYQEFSDVMANYVAGYELMCRETMGLYSDMETQDLMAQDRNVQARFFRSFGDYLRGLPEELKFAPLPALTAAYRDRLSNSGKCPSGSPARASFELATRLARIRVPDHYSAQFRQEVENVVSLVTEALMKGKLEDDANHYRRVLILWGRDHPVAETLAYKILGLVNTDSGSAEYLKFPGGLQHFVSILNEVMQIRVPEAYAGVWGNFIRRLLMVAIRDELNPVRVHHMERALARVLVLADAFDPRRSSPVGASDRIHSTQRSHVNRMKAQFEEMLAVLENPVMAESMNIASFIFHSNAREAIAVFETILERFEDGLKNIVKLSRRKARNRSPGGSQSSPPGSAPPVAPPATPAPMGDSAASAMTIEAWNSFEITAAGSDAITSYYADARAWRNYEWDEACSADQPEEDPSTYETGAGFYLGEPAGMGIALP